MRPLPPAVILAALCAGSAPAEMHRRVSAPDGQKALPSPAPTHRIALQVVILRGSKWTYDEVERRVAKARQVIGQCGVRLDAAITELAAPSGSPDVSYAEASADAPDGMGTIARALAQPKPTLFYIRNFSDNSAQTGTSRPVFTSADKAELDTAWVTWSDEPPGWQANYSVDAHELTHVLANTPHVSLPNNCPPRAHKEDPVDPACADGGLMAGNSLIRSNRISDAVCEKLRSGPHARPL